MFNGGRILTDNTHGDIPGRLEPGQRVGQSLGSRKRGAPNGVVEVTGPELYLSGPESLLPESNLITLEEPPTH